MERFDIALFKQQQQSGIYRRESGDSTIIEQFQVGEGFGEKISQRKSWFYTYKEYYPTGILETKGQYFAKGDFKAGEWIECNEQGEVISKKNYDKDYRLDVFAIMEILKARQIPFSLQQSDNEITRNIKKGRPTWFISHMVDFSSIETIEIDDATGKIVNQSSMKFRSVN